MGSMLPDIAAPWILCVYIYIYIWVNYNDLTATEPWNHGEC